MSNHSSAAAATADLDLFGDEILVDPYPAFHALRETVFRDPKSYFQRYESLTEAEAEATAQKIDSEVRRIIEESYTRANKILTDRIGDLHIVAKGLLEYETLTGDEIKALLRGERPVRTPYEEPEPVETKRPATVPSSARQREPGGFISPEPQPGT